jgi:putative NADH-flavin reductase
VIETHKRILLFGGSGRTGVHLIDYALAQNLQVVALVRNPRKIPQRPGLTLVQGTPENIADVRHAITGCDAVVSALSAASEYGSPFANPESFPRLMATSVLNAVSEMKALGLRRIVVLSGIGVGDSYPFAPLWLRLLIKVFMRAGYLDHQAQELALRNSGLDWTSVRAAMLNNNTKIEDIVISYDNVPTPAFGISRKHLAKFMIDSLDRHDLFGKAPVLSER